MNWDKGLDVLAVINALRVAFPRDKLIDFKPLNHEGDFHASTYDGVPSTLVWKVLPSPHHFFS